jgi:hypothetical protein
MEGKRKKKKDWTKEGREVEALILVRSAPSPERTKADRKDFKYVRRKEKEKEEIKERKRDEKRYERRTKKKKIMKGICKLETLHFGEICALHGKDQVVESNRERIHKLNVRDGISVSAQLRRLNGHLVYKLCKYNVKLRS